MKIKLKEKRTESGLSIRKLAELSGVSKSLIEKIESSGGNPTIETICKLADTLDVTLEELVDRHG